ncbi:exodeoxyribonuclease V subunit alpha [Sphaerotilus microaerophilus]|uniref:RecBCD enzyme subunit RecD n=1 Tax=Sphaerotilus microaerophilus TaxID=2914710 RepID=A0ABN6PL93_9BURK|nr:exodeoxyribonuclease V subunit alpha [Sphaerotilus sp. FB-5]BDI04967.1 RecBCD enzyme subunit RecD [Sphaerotilus sp. FB-5]
MTTLNLPGPAQDQSPHTAPDTPPDAAAVLAELARWAELGWLRRLDLALARWLQAELPDSPPELLLAAALLAQREGRGHSCIVLADLLALADAAVPVPTDLALQAAEVDEWLDGPEPAQQALRSLMARLVAEASAPGLAHWEALFAASPAVQVLAPGVPETGGAGPATPLLLEGGRLYLRRHWREECLVAAEVLARVGPAPMPASGAVNDLVAEAPPPDPAEVRAWLDRLFTPREPGAPLDWQRAACAVALRGRLALITGGPGTGKTYTVARLLALVFALQPPTVPLRIALAAPTGKAAARLKQSIDLALQGLRQAQPGLLDWDLLAQRLAQAHTLHKLLGARPDTRHLRHDARHPLEVDLLVVDEASMVHLELMAALLAALPRRARLLLLGDKDQLASVEAGAVLGDLCADAEAGRYGSDTAGWIAACTGAPLPAPYLAAPGEASALAQQTVMLRESRRFHGAIGQLAQAVNAGDASVALQRLQAPGPELAHLADPQPGGVLRLALQGRAGAEGGYGPFLQALGERPPPSASVEDHAAWVRRVLGAFDRFRLLCALREGDWGVAGLNRAIEQALRQRGLIHGGASAGLGNDWYEGRPVMVTRNDSALGVYNGDVGLALRAAPTPASGQGSGSGPARRAGPLRVWFADGDQLRSVLASRLAAVETAWAMTVHKSQGSEFEHTVLVLPPRANPVATRELVYTGITRARSRFTLVAAQPAVFEQAVRRRTRRASGLPMRLAGTAE